MIKLGDFIGTLLADVSSARARADIEALKLAEVYSGHELLRHMPVPHFRLPDISVDINVLLDGIVDQPDKVGKTGATHLLAPSAGEVNKVVRRSLAESGIRLTGAERMQVYAATQRQIRGLLDQAPAGFVNSRKLSATLADASQKAIARILKAKGETDEAAAERMTASLKGGLSRLMVGKLTRAPYLKVAVKSSEIKEHADHESMLRIRLSISEDSYEIVADEPEAGGGIRLTPE